MYVSDIWTSASAGLESPVLPITLLHLSILLIEDPQACAAQVRQDPSEVQWDEAYNRTVPLPGLGTTARESQMML